MKVCKDCFKDQELRFYIETHGQVDACDLCSKDSKVIDIGEIADFLIEYLNLFEIYHEGDPVEMAFKTLGLHTKKNKHTNAIISELSDHFNSRMPLGSKVRIRESINDGIENWQRLKDEIKTHRRYLNDIEFLEEVINWIELTIIPIGKKFFRGRTTLTDSKKFRASEMSAPPADKATPGRANPLGIPYLYLCEKEMTTLYEIRSSYLDRVCIGEFQTNQELRIIDLTKELSPFSLFSRSNDEGLMGGMKIKRLIDAIGVDMSKPLRRYDSEIEYIPTQLFCEYCKESSIDGILYASSLHKDGKNLVVFYPDKLDCINVKLVEVDNVNIDFKDIDVD